MNLFYSRRLVQAIGYGAVVALSVGLASRACAQNGYYQTNFDSDSGGETLSMQDGWTDSDPHQPDSVGFVGGYSNSGSDYIASMGGAFISTPGAGPSVSPGYLSHPFASPTASYRFDVDYFVTNSVTGYGTTNAFAFTFQSANGANIFSVDLVPNGTDSTNTTADAIRYSVYNPAINPLTPTVQTSTQTSTALGSVLGSRYHLSLVTNELTNTFGFTITGETPGGVLSATPYYTSPSISSTLLVGSVADIAATYLNGANGGPGSNALFFDNFSAVPEPSTWAMMGLGALSLAASFRRKARA